MDGQKLNSHIDAWTDGQPDGLMVRRTMGRSDEQTDGKKHNSLLNHIILVFSLTTITFPNTSYLKVIYPFIGFSQTENLYRNT